MTPMRIAFIGSGQVGGALADRLQRVGHHVELAAGGARDESIRRAVARNERLVVRPSREAVRDAQIVFLATPFAANAAAIGAVADLLDGKVLVDCTNPVGPGSASSAGSRSTPGRWIRRSISST